MEENNRIIDYISEIAGAGVGAGIGLLVAGPVGAVGGAIASPIITNMLKWCANEAKEKRYSTREGKNIVKVLSYANSDCQYNSENSEGSFDEDWFARFINIAKDIHSDELQTIWGKILAKDLLIKVKWKFQNIEFEKKGIRNQAAEQFKIERAAGQGGV